MTNELETQPEVRPATGDEAKALFNLTGNFTFWFALMIFALSVTVEQINLFKIFPKEIISPAMHTRAACNFKYDEWQKLTGRQDIVIVGSSLPMCCFYYADKEKDAETFLKIKEKGLKLLQAYTAANYLEEKIKQKTGKQANVFNMTVAAAMISDVQLITSKMFTNPPKKIILGVGMRDFADNINISFGGTPVFQSLIDLPYILASDNLAFLLKNAKRTTLEELLTNRIIPLYNLHSELGTWLNEETSKMFRLNKKPVPETKYKKDTRQVANTQSGGVTSSDKSTSTKPVALDPLDYQKRYMPFNRKQMELEQKSLERICQLCKEKNVELILVNMPVSSGHKELSSKVMRKNYLDSLKAISTKYGIKYVDFENSALIPDRDFLDTVHLGPSGATKFVDYLVNDSGVF